MNDETVRLDNDSWELLKPGWDQAPWQVGDTEEVTFDEEDAHWAEHTIDAECCHETPASTLIPALLRLLGMREDYV